MFISEIKVEGFKTFGNATSLGPFFPGTNVLVGRNGSGKTSILDAIEFVLGEVYPTLKKDEFNKLNCHDTKNKKENFISVEIILDNSDQKYKAFPPKFSIIRKTTMAIDHYIVNGQKVFRKQFLKITRPLDIGISALKQGEVIQFATLSDEKRLKILFKMIGYKKLERSKQDKWNDTIEKRSEIMTEVKKCYDSLEKDHNLLLEFRGILKQKEMIIYVKEKKKLIGLQNNKRQLEQKLVNWLEKNRNKKPKYIELKSKVDLLECQLTEVNGVLQTLENEKEKIIDQIKELENQISELKISILDNENNNKEQEVNLENMKKKLELLEKKIASEEESIQPLKLELLSVTDKVKKLEVKYFGELLDLDYLKSKLSANKKPVNKEEREELISKNIKVYEESIAEKQKLLENYQNQKQEKTDKILVYNEKISSIKTEIEILKVSLQDYSTIAENYQKKITITSNLLKNIAEKKAEVSGILRLFQNNYKQNCKKLKSAVKCDVMYNKSAVEDALKSLNNETSKKKMDVSMYHGFVIDCFEFSPEIEAAILAVAGKRLFNFVFEYGKDAHTVVKKIEDHDYLALVSLDLLTVSKNKLPSIPDTIPLITLLTFKPIYTKLMQFMFGNVLVCKTTQTALNLSKKYKITCVTLYGSVFFPNGLSEAGNWNENERNQFFIYQSMAKQLEEIKDKESKIKELNDQELSLNNMILECSEAISMLETRKKDAESKKIMLESDLSMLEYELSCVIIESDECEKLKHFVEVLTEKIERLQLELNNCDKGQVTAEEYQRYKKLETSTKKLMRLWTDEETKMNEFNQKITLKSDILEKVYSQMKNDLQYKIKETIFQIEMVTRQIKDDMVNLECKEQILEEENQKLENLKKKIKTLQTITKELSDTKNEKSDQAEELEINVHVNDADIEHLKTKCSELQKVIDKAQCKIDNISHTWLKSPDPELENIEKLTMKQIFDLQKIVDNKLKKFSHDVNVNASEMFSRQQDDVEKAKSRIQKIGDTKARIDLTRKLCKSALQNQIYIELLDIDNNFKRVINKFIPHAHAALILITQNQDYSVEEAKDANVDLNDFIGVSIKFSKSKDRWILQLNELSGGQSTILSLALNLAIQNCYGIPIVLYDEIDQALDSIYRQALHGIIREMDSLKQIFLTTFRPELVEVGDHLYLVEKHGTTSKIKEINQQEASNFLKLVKQE